MESNSLIALCSARRWKKALFTTYTLSLSFFEAYILPRLEEQGCGDILILVDHSYYLESLSERQSRGAGRSYRIIPIYMASRDGIFHPKLTYLQGESEDLCAIGSGNLTYAGQGMNLECLDVILSSREPQAFRGVADFFDSLLSTKTIQIGGERDRLELYKTRAARFAERTDPGRQPIIVHSIREPIADQIVQLIGQHGPFRRVVCMAPFHHPAGEPLFNLALSLGAKRVEISVDPRTKNAPFNAVRFAPKSLDVAYVTPKGEAGRELHAKWYEFHGARTYLLTGSVNATLQSLSSSKNVEVAVLREIVPETSVTWIASQPKSYADTGWHGAAAAFDGLITATITMVGMLVGNVIGVREPAGRWRATLFGRDRQLVVGDAIVDDMGRFSIPVDEGFAELLKADEAVHLRMVRGVATVGGWVLVQSDLEESLQVRGTRRAVERLSRGLGIRGDVIRVVQWICGLIPMARDKELRNSGTEARGIVISSGGTEEAMSYTHWARAVDSPRGASSNIGALIQRAIKVLSESSGASHKRAPAGGVLLGDEGEVSDDSEDSVSQEEYWELRTVVEAIDEAIRARPENPANLEFLKARALLTVRSIWLGPGPYGHSSREALAWIRLAQATNLKDSYRNELRELAWMMAGVVQGYTPDDSAAGQAATLRASVDSIHAEHDVRSPEIIFEAVRNEGLIANVPEEVIATCRKGIAVVASAATIQTDLSAFLDDLRRGVHPEPTEALRQAIRPDILKKVQRHGRRWTRLPEWKARSCPHCYCGLTSNEQGDLKNKRILICRQCQMPLVWLGN